MQEHDFIMNIILLGEVESGKTSFKNRLMHDKFRQDYESTIGIEINLTKNFDSLSEIQEYEYLKLSEQECQQPQSAQDDQKQKLSHDMEGYEEIVEVNLSSGGGNLEQRYEQLEEGYKIKFRISDMGGGLETLALFQECLEKQLFILLFYDYHEKLENIKSYLSFLEQQAPESHILLVLNKSDLKMAQDPEIIDYIAKDSLVQFSISCKTNHGIKELIKFMIEQSIYSLQNGQLSNINTLKFGNTVKSSQLRYQYQQSHFTNESVPLKQQDYCFCQ